jgi:hypothetical protein
MNEQKSLWPWAQQRQQIAIHVWIITSPNVMSWESIERKSLWR